MIVKLTGEFATLTGRQEVEIYGPHNIKTLLSALDNAYPNYGWDNSNVAINIRLLSIAKSNPISLLTFFSIVSGGEYSIIKSIENPINNIRIVNMRVYSNKIIISD